MLVEQRQSLVHRFAGHFRIDAVGLQMREVPTVNIDTANALLEDHGIGVNLTSQIQGQDTHITAISTGTGFARSLVVTANQEARLVSLDEAQHQVLGIPGSNGVFIGVIEKDGIFLAPLGHRPKGVVTRVYVAEERKAASEEASANWEAVAKLAQQKINPEDCSPHHAITITPEEAREVGLDYIAGLHTVQITEEGLVWIPPKERRLRRQPAATFLKNTSGEDPTTERLNILNEAVRKSPCLVERRSRNVAVPFNVDDYVNSVLTSENPAVIDFFSAQFQGRVAHIMEVFEGPLGEKAIKSIPTSVALFALQSSQGKEYAADQKVAEYIAAQEVARVKQETLFNIGLSRMGGIPFDIYAQSHLEEHKLAVSELDDAVVDSALAGEFKTRDPEKFRQLMSSSLAIRKEELAYVEARKTAYTKLVTLAEADVSAHELSQYFNENKKVKVTPEPAGKSETPTLTELVSPDGYRIAVSEVFSEGKVSPLSRDQWCRLPLRPALSPRGSREAARLSPQEQALFIFDKILFSPMVCDRNGVEVAMSAEAKQWYIDKVAFAIQHGVPVEISQYTPLAAINNPLKRFTQSPAMAEVDFVRRLAEIAHAVKMIYPKGLHWTIINEVPAFGHTAMLNFRSEYVDRFHREVEAMIKLIDTESSTITLLRLDNLLWGTPERQRAWQSYYQETREKLEKTLTDTSHPDHEKAVDEIATFVYPMSTCTDPYQFPVARSLRINDIVRAYAHVRAGTGSKIRGVGLSAGNGDGEELTADQRELADLLIERGRQMAMIYRLTMNSRGVLPVFKEVVPEHALPFTMVTKTDKPVLYPNSGRGAYFPAHGEPVLLRSADPHQRTTVTVRPWWHIASHADRYIPVFDPTNAEEPLYFEEKP